MLICQVEPVFAGVNDFEFSDFVGDYYLSRDEDGVSHLKVVENVTAVFPDYPQNKGICRQIPFTNQGGANITLPSLTENNLRLTRNGVAEPIYSIEKGDGYYNVCTGTEEYVLGRQTYTFEYEFEKVVTDFQEYQELYWDTNGNGAMQRFAKVTARVHFVGDVLNDYTGDNWCYVGRYGEKGSGRCEITKMEGGVEFTARNLGAYENMTFDVELRPGAFVVPIPEKDYTYVWITIVAVIICLALIGRGTWKYVKTRDKEKFYKGLFVKPEYQPSAEYDLTEMTEIYLGKKKDAKVAMLLELVVTRKIEFIKIDKKKWGIIVKNLEGVKEEYVDLLTILNGGGALTNDAKIELKSRAASSKLIAIRRAMESKILKDLKRDGLVEKKYTIGASSKRGISNVVAMSIVIVPVAVMLAVWVMGMLNEMMGLDELQYGKDMVFDKEYYITVLAMIVATVPILIWLSDKRQRYEGHTEAGLRASRYMDGLKLYISMAESERMKMLQSVDGADVSAKGIVKLYEKLLPYAAVFGLEESWMNEMKEYCEVQEVKEPDYLMSGITASEITRSVSRAASYATAASTMSSSGGGSSSGFSGGGGGGFSGGGGGGGGFSGR